MILSTTVLISLLRPSFPPPAAVEGPSRADQLAVHHFHHWRFDRQIFVSLLLYSRPSTRSRNTQTSSPVPPCSHQLRAPALLAWRPIHRPVAYTDTGTSVYLSPFQHSYPRYLRGSTLPSVTSHNRQTSFPWYQTNDQTPSYTVIDPQQAITKRFWPGAPDSLGRGRPQLAVE
jgi:hypothetical protein